MKALSLRQAAKQLNVHHATLRRWIIDGEGPRAFIKRGRRSTYRITATDLDAFIDRNSKGTK
jgi:excisionase family DNA binding protein